MNIKKKKLKAKLYQKHYKLHPLKILSVDHAPESLSKYMTTIYDYFCIKKMNIFRIF